MFRWRALGDREKTKKRLNYERDDERATQDAAEQKKEKLRLHHFGFQIPVYNKSVRSGRHQRIGAPRADQE